MWKRRLGILWAAGIAGCGRTDIGEWSRELGGAAGAPTHPSFPAAGNSGRGSGGQHHGVAGASAGDATTLGGSGGARAGAGGRSPGGSAGMSGAAGKACGPLIDDMESDSGHICQGDGRHGVWYSFNDGTGTQWPPPTTPGTPIAMSASTRPGSRYAVHTYGDSFARWGAGIGADFDYDGATYLSYDAAHYDGVTFWAQSGFSNVVDVRLSTPTTTESQYGGTCPSEPCPSPLAVKVHLTPTWTRYQIAFNDFDTSYYAPTLERHELLNIQFLSPGPTFAFDLWIDDLTFYVAPHDCCSTLPAGCRGVLTFADPGLSSAVRELTGASGDVRCEDICTHPLLGAASRNIQSLEGMQCLTLLTGLDLSHNPIRDMTPLAQLGHLRGLDLDYTEISTFPNLRGMTALENLGLDGAPVVDLGPLLDLPSLTAVGVSQAKLDCAAQAQNLAALKARAIVFSDCP